MHADDTDFSVYLITSFGLPPHTLSRLLRFTWCRRRRLEPSVSMSKRHRNRLSRFQQIPPKHRILNELVLYFLKSIRAEEKKTTARQRAHSQSMYGKTVVIVVFEPFRKSGRALNIGLFIRKDFFCILYLTKNTNENESMLAQNVRMLVGPKHFV